MVLSWIVWAPSVIQESVQILALMMIEASVFLGSASASQGSQVHHVLKGNVPATTVLGMDFVMAKLDYANVTKGTLVLTAPH